MRVSECCQLYSQLDSLQLGPLFGLAWTAFYVLKKARFCKFFLLRNNVLAGRFEEPVIEERRKAALELLTFAGSIPDLFTSQPFVKFFEVSIYLLPNLYTLSTAIWTCWLVLKWSSNWQFLTEIFPAFIKHTYLKTLTKTCIEFCWSFYYLFNTHSRIFGVTDS